MTPPSRIAAANSQRMPPLRNTLPARSCGGDAACHEPTSPTARTPAPPRPTAPPPRPARPLPRPPPSAPRTAVGRSAATAPGRGRPCCKPRCGPRPGPSPPGHPHRGRHRRQRQAGDARRAPAAARPVRRPATADDRDSAAGCTSPQTIIDDASAPRVSISRPWGGRAIPAAIDSAPATAPASASEPSCWWMTSTIPIAVTPWVSWATSPAAAWRRAPGRLRTLRAGLANRLQRTLGTGRSAVSRQSAARRAAARSRSCSCSTRRLSWLQRSSQRGPRRSAQRRARPPSRRARRRRRRRRAAARPGCGRSGARAAASGRAGRRP